MNLFLIAKTCIMKHKKWHKRRIFTTVLAVLLLISILFVGLWQLVTSQTTTESGEEETTIELREKETTQELGEEETTTELGEEETTNQGIVGPGQPC